MVVGVKNGKISKVTKGADKIFAISSRPVVVGNMVDDSLKYKYELAAFLGQAHVWVLGKVNSGDYIVASGKNNGAAIAVSPEDLTQEQLTQIVGRAWESSDDANLKLVNVAVGIESGETAQILLKQQNNIDALQANVDELEAKLEGYADLEQRICELEKVTEEDVELQASK